MLVYRWCMWNFDCPKQSLYRWVKRYEELEEIKRPNRKAVSYKITKEQVKYAIQKLKENEQITMEELHKIVKKEYKDFLYYISTFRSSNEK